MMDKADRIVIAVALFATVVAFWTIIYRENALEVRLQKVEHLLSLSASESRSSASLGPTNGLPAFTYEKGKGADVKVERRAKRKPSNNSSKNDRRTEGQ